MKNKRRYLEGFEELTLMSIIYLGEDAYGVSIRHNLEETANRSVSVGALYATLDRLEEKGFVDTWLGEGTAERGGRPKRFYRVNGTGEKALQEAEDVRRKMSASRNAASSRARLAGGVA